MHLIIGGYAQGKCAYAIERYHLCANDIWDAEKNELADWQGQRLILHMETLVEKWMQAGKEPLEMIECWIPKWKDTVIVSREVGCGLVPISAEARAIREAIGRINTRLAAASETVERVMCGLGMYLKGQEQQICGS